MVALGNRRSQHNPRSASRAAPFADHGAIGSALHGGLARAPTPDGAVPQYFTVFVRNSSPRDPAYGSKISAEKNPHNASIPSAPDVSTLFKRTCRDIRAQE